MIIIGVTMVRDEQDVIETTVRHMLAVADRVVVADNLSSDDTRDILVSLAADYGRRLSLLTDSEPGYNQGAKMGTLARYATMHFDADWIIPFDADEIWTAPEHNTIGAALGSLPPEQSSAIAVMYDHVVTGLDEPGLPPQYAMTWRRAEQSRMFKVAFRPRPFFVIGEGNHFVSYDLPPQPPTLAVHHFPYRSADHMVAKARRGVAAYAASDHPEDVGQVWRHYERQSDDDIRASFREHYYVDDPREGWPRYVHDPAPVLG